MFVTRTRSNVAVEESGGVGGRWGGGVKVLNCKRVNRFTYLVVRVGSRAVFENMALLGNKKIPPYIGGVGDIKRSLVFTLESRKPK